MKKIVLIAVLIGAGYFVYTEFFSVSDEILRVKKLFDKVSSTPVSAEEAKPIFKDSMVETCKVNGVDTINGYGNVDECRSNFETLASEHCFDQISDFEGKIYKSKEEVMADLLDFNLCSTMIVKEAIKHK